MFDFKLSTFFTNYYPYSLHVISSVICRLDDPTGVAQSSRSCRPVGCRPVGLSPRGDIDFVPDMRADHSECNGE